MVATVVTSLDDQLLSLACIPEWLGIFAWRRDRLIEESHSSPPQDEARITEGGWILIDNASKPSNKGVLGIFYLPLATLLP